MDDLLLSLLGFLPGILLVLLLLLSVLIAVRRRRRARAPRSVPVAVTDTVDDQAIIEALTAPDPEKSSGAMVSREQRRIADTVLSSARRSHGRHSAELPAPSGVLLLLLVPIAAKRRRRPLGVSPRLVSIPTDSVDDVAVVEDPADRASGAAAIAAPGSSEVDFVDRDTIAAADRDIRTYRRRVHSTIQAMSRCTEPGEPPELVEARMLAAMDRLDGPLGFARPRLSPSSPHRSLGQLGHTPQRASTTSPAALPSGELAAERPVGDVAPEAAPPMISENAPKTEGPESEEAHPQESALEEAEVVLPVPPMSSSDNTRRRGLRRRGKAG